MRQGGSEVHIAVGHKSSSRTGIYRTRTNE